MRKLKIGVWQFTSERYSGGRVYLWQYCWACASLGADVTFLTNRAPLWADDYPQIDLQGSLCVEEDKGVYPQEFDIVITDAKCQQAQRALEYKRKHPKALLVIVNFETSNWVQKYDKHYAALDSTDKSIAACGDYFISISELAKQHLVAWLNIMGDKVCIVNPAVNHLALEQRVEHKVEQPRPYAVWTGHAHRYKGWSTAVKSIWDLPCQFDLVVFGETGVLPRRSPYHSIINKSRCNEAQKFSWMANAHMCIAPSLFEGYGMVPGESLSVGTQCIAYDLPVLREAYGLPLGLHLCDWGDISQFCEMVKQVAFSDKPVLSPAAMLSKHSLTQMIKTVASLPFHQ